jgi:hypothetical protein
MLYQESMPNFKIHGRKSKKLAIGLTLTPAKRGAQWLDMNE